MSSAPKLDQLVLQWAANAKRIRKQQDALLPNRAGDAEYGHLEVLRLVYESCAAELADVIAADT